MAIVKIVKNNYSSSNSNFIDGIDFTMLSYITDWYKCKSRYVFGYNVLLASPKVMAEQFQIVRQIFNKETGRLIRHFIVSFSEYEPVDTVLAANLGLEIAKYYADQYQIIFAVHEDTDNIHIHFILNTVSFIDGGKFNEGPAELRAFVDYLNRLHPPILFGVDEHKQMGV